MCITAQAIGISAVTFRRQLTQVRNGKMLLIFPLISETQRQRERARVLAAAITNVKHKCKYICNTNVLQMNQQKIFCCCNCTTHKLTHSLYFFCSTGEAGTEGIRPVANFAPLLSSYSDFSYFQKYYFNYLGYYRKITCTPNYVACKITLSDK